GVLGSSPVGAPYPGRLIFRPEVASHYLPRSCAGAEDSAIASAKRAAQFRAEASALVGCLPSELVQRPLSQVIGHNLEERSACLTWLQMHVMRCTRQLMDRDLASRRQVALHGLHIHGS